MLRGTFRFVLIAVLLATTSPASADIHLIEPGERLTPGPQEALRRGLAEREARFERQRREAAGTPDSQAEAEADGRVSRQGELATAASGAGTLTQWLGALVALLLVAGLLAGAVILAERQPGGQEATAAPAEADQPPQPPTPPPATTAPGGNVTTPRAGQGDPGATSGRPGGRPIIDTDPGNNARAAVKALALFIAAASLGTAAVIGIFGPMIGFAAAWVMANWVDRRWPKAGEGDRLPTKPTTPGDASLANRRS